MGVDWLEARTIVMGSVLAKLDARIREGKTMLFCATLARDRAYERTKILTLVSFYCELSGEDRTLADWGIE